MGLLDDILKELEEQQQRGEGRRPPAAGPAGRPPPPARPEREQDDDGAEWEEEDEAARPGHAPHIPPRRAPAAEVAPAPEPPAHRTTADSKPAVAPHLVGAQPAVRIRAMIASRQAIRDALIAREILGPPPGLRRLRRR